MEGIEDCLGKAEIGVVPDLVDEAGGENSHFTQVGDDARRFVWVGAELADDELSGVEGESCFCLGVGELERLSGVEVGDGRV